MRTASSVVRPGLSSIVSPVSSTQNPKPAKKRRLAQYVQNIKDSYTISRRTYPWIGWAMLGSAAAVMALAVGLSLATGIALWYCLSLGLLVALLAVMTILSLAVRRAAYTQIEGHPGAAKAALDQVGRGWYVESDPAAINPKTQEVVWRLVGRPGIVLVAEGHYQRAQKLAKDEHRKVHRILSTVPIHTIYVGTGEDQVRLKDLQSTLRKLPTKPLRLTDSEISQVAKRLTSLSHRSMPQANKGLDPTKVRIDRRAMRGR